MRAGYIVWECVTRCENIFTIFFFLHRFSSIHQEAPEFIDMSVEQEILETGIKVVDLLAPYARGGKIGKLLPLSF